nr:histidine kinase [uncultured Mucilaginibacter sp.]
MQTLRQARYPAFLRHLLFWLAYIGYLALTDAWEDKDELIFQIDPQFTTDVPLVIALCYFNLYVLMPAYYHKHKYFHYAGALAILLLVAGLLARFFNYAIWVPWDKIHEPAVYAAERKDFWIEVRIVRNAAKQLPVIMITMLVKLMRNALVQEKHMRELEKEKFSAEMGLLKAQINPHFFFNTLNSLYALTLRGSQQASAVVLRLSELMHYMLYEAAAPKVLLLDEIKHLESFIGIEQMRFADRLELSFQYSGDLAGKMIAPLLLLPFVENAFKHSLADGNGWITISLKVAGDKLFLKVENSCAEAPADGKKGLGLKNVQRRLALTYPGRHQLRLRQNSGTYEADLKLDL